MFNKSTSSFFKICFFISIVSVIFLTSSREVYADIVSVDTAMSRLTDKEAIADLNLAKVDAQRLYDGAISRGVTKEVAQTQYDKVIQAGVNRAIVKEENGASGNGGLWVTATAIVGIDTPQNNRQAAIANADKEYEKAQAEASRAVGDTKQAEYAEASAQGYKEIAGAAKKGAFTSEGNQSVGASKTTNPSISSSDSKVYNLLAPIETFFPGGKIDVAGGGLSSYLDGIYKAGIAIATGLALLMIVIGGVQYVSTDAIGGKSEGRQRINNAVIGLLLALGSWILLQQINPSLLNNDLNMEATKPVAKLDQVDIELSSVKGTNRPNTPPPDVRSGVDVSNLPQTQQMLNGFQGTINSAVQGSGFKTMGIPNMEWQAYAARLVQSTGLINYKPTDAANFFPNGQITVEGWVGIIGGIIKKESNFKPTLTFPEPAPLNYNSVGLLQLSAVDAEARSAGCNEACLKNPLRNLEIGIAIMARQLRKDNCIRCKSSGGSWRGLAAYWSTIR